MNEPIPYGRQHITEEDITAVVEVLKSDYLTQGPRISAFEEAFAAYVGSRYAVAVSNGTAALHLCALALGVREGDKVITTPLTFVASANCIRYAGGEVVFADIDPDSYLLDVHAVRRLLEASPVGTYKGIVPVDFAGRAVNLEEYRELADEFGLWMIEDACHAPGGYFIGLNGDKQHCGNGKFAELAIFSFHPVKHIAAGEGGMITTNDESLYQQLLRLRSHGITKSAENYSNTVEFAAGGVTGITEWPGWYMEMQELGFNYRLTDFQAALGISQLKRAGEGLSRRRQIAEKYFEAFKEKSYVLGQSAVVDGHAYHLYVIEVEDRLGLYNFLHKHKIYVQIHYIPCHLMPFYRQDGWKEGDLPIVEQYYRYCISLPIYPRLDEETLNYIIDTIDEYYKQNI